VSLENWLEDKHNRPNEYEWTKTWIKNALTIGVKHTWIL